MRFCPEITEAKGTGVLMLTVGSCFSGIGGLELGLEQTGGFKTKWQIEIDPYAFAVLAKHWPNVKRYKDITAVSGEELERVDLICGGFPCQDVSLAGTRSGLEGKRSTLWGEMYRLICEVKPRWVLAENVPGLFSSDAGQFFGNILRDLAIGGYDAEWNCLPAAAVGAPHIRNRVFILAYSRSESFSCGRIFRENSADIDVGWENSKEWGIDRVIPSMGTSLIRGLQTRWVESNSKSKIPRMVDGIPCGLDRIKCLGNAVVPAVAKRIGEMILKVESK